MAINKVISVACEMDETFRIEGKLGSHTCIIDQPKAGGGQDQGPTPLEYFLFSLGGCVASIGRIMANQQKINLRGMTVVVEAGMNAAGLMGKPTDDRVGFQSFDVKAEIDADMTDEEKLAFLHQVCEPLPGTRQYC